MAPKAKSASAWAAGNARGKQRREAVAALNRLAEEVGTAQVRLKAPAGAVEKLVRLLDARCHAGDLPGRLRDAVRLYLDNGGSFSVPVLLADIAAGAAATGEGHDADSDPPPPVLRHRLLDEGFRLRSKAFMLTFNSRAFTATWPVFLRWVKDRYRELGARRWAASLVESVEATHRARSGGAAAAPVYHTHAYLWWLDGVGLVRRNTDDLVFDGVRPRVDVCTCHATKSRALRVAAAHGLWYVAVMKDGTVASDSNFVAWRDFVPKAEWARSLWDAHKTHPRDVFGVVAQTPFGPFGPQARRQRARGR